jgi:hypothetical protein
MHRQVISSHGTLHGRPGQAEGQSRDNGSNIVSISLR